MTYVPAQNIIISKMIFRSWTVLLLYTKIDIYFISYNSNWKITIMACYVYPSGFIYNNEFTSQVTIICTNSNISHVDYVDSFSRKIFLSIINTKCTCSNNHFILYDNTRNMLLNTIH